MDDEIPFSARRTLDGDVSVVTLEGELDLSNVDPVRTELVAAAGEAATIVLDLRDVGFVDSSGIRLLVETERMATERGIAFLVVRGPGHILRLFDLAGITERLSLIDDPAEAVGRGGAPQG